jgi:uncharacterized iron-regulated membrane protein
MWRELQLAASALAGVHRLKPMRQAEARATLFSACTPRVPESSIVKKAMSLRTAVLKIHLYLGLVAALFLVILGLTGSIMAFEGDLDHWLHRNLWYVTPSGRPLPENDLISMAQHQFPRTRVVAVQFFREANLAQTMQLTDGTRVFINPYDGSILGSTIGAQNLDVALGYIHQMHLRLTPDPRYTPNLAVLPA